jgi:hypothetical protein
MKQRARAVTTAVKIRLLRRHVRDGVLLLPGSEIPVPVEEADRLITRGYACEVCLITEAAAAADTHEA